MGKEFFTHFCCKIGHDSCTFQTQNCNKTLKKKQNKEICTAQYSVKFTSEEFTRWQILLMIFQCFLWRYSFKLALQRVNAVSSLFANRLYIYYSFLSSSPISVILQLLLTAEDVNAPGIHLRLLPGERSCRAGTASWQGQPFPGLCSHHPYEWTFTHTEAGKGWAKDDSFLVYFHKINGIRI